MNTIAEIESAIEELPEAQVENSLAGLKLTALGCPDLRLPKLG